MAFRYDKKIRAAVLRHVRTAAKQGKTLEAITDVLNGLNYSRPNGTAFTTGSVAAILRGAKISLRKSQRKARTKVRAVTPRITAATATFANTFIQPVTSAEPTVPAFVKELLVTDRVSNDWKVNTLRQFWSV